MRSGLVRGAYRRRTSPSLLTRNLVKFHLMRLVQRRPGRAGISGIRAERVGVGAVDFYFGEERERGAVVLQAGQKFLISSALPGSW